MDGGKRSSRPVIGCLIIKIMFALTALVELLVFCDYVMFGRRFFDDAKGLFANALVFLLLCLYFADDFFYRRKVYDTPVPVIIVMTLSCVVLLFF